MIRKLLNPILKLLLQSQHAHSGAGQADRDQRALRKAVQPSSREEPAARRSRRAVLRARAQPGAGADAHRHRESQSQDAAGVAVEPDGLRRAARTGARRRRPVSAGHRSRARATAAATASGRAPSTAAAACIVCTASRFRCSRRSLGPRAEEQAGESNTARRRRRRRRGRRGGRSRTPGEGMAAGGAPTEVASPEDSATPPHGDPTADAASNDASDADFDDDPAAGDDRDDSGEEPDPSAQ